MREKSTLGLTTAAILGCSFSRVMVLSGGTSRRSAPSGTRRGVVCGGRSGCFQLLALFTLGFWTLLLRARVSVLWRQSTVEFHLSFGDFARAVRTWISGHYSFCAILGSAVDTSSLIALGGNWTNFQHLSS